MTPAEKKFFKCMKRKTSYSNKKQHTLKIDQLQNKWTLNNMLTMTVTWTLFIFNLKHILFQRYSYRSYCHEKRDDI